MGDKNEGIATPLSNLVILGIEIAEREISLENVQALLASKEFGSSLTRALNEIVSSEVKNGKLQNLDSATVEKRLTEKLPDAAKDGAAKFAGKIYEQKYKAEIEKNVDELKDSVTDYLNTKLAPGVYLAKELGLILIVIGVPVLLQNRELVMSEVKELCVANKFLCSKVSELAFNKFMKYKHVGTVTVDAAGTLKISPDYKEANLKFFGTLKYQQLDVKMQTEFNFELVDTHRVKDVKASAVLNRQLTKDWSVGGAMKYTQGKEGKSDELDLSLRFDRKDEDWKLSVEFGMMQPVSTGSSRPELRATANLQLFSW
jgi:hypothetical protein